MRLAITAQVVGGMNITNAEEFKCCVGMSLYRTNASVFPLPQNAYNITSLRNASVATHEGTYTWNLSGAVSKKQKIAQGIYILVPSTFDPGVFAHFEAILYSATPVM